MLFDGVFKIDVLETKKMGGIYLLGRNLHLHPYLTNLYLTNLRQTQGESKIYKSESNNFDIHRILKLK